MNNVITICLIALISTASLAGESFGGIYLDSSVPSHQLYSLKQDLSYLYTSEVNHRDSELASLFGLSDVNGPHLYNWIHNRVKYIVGQDYQVRGRNIVKKKGHNFPSTPLPSSVYNKNDSYGGVVIMTNLGAQLYLQGKKSSLLRGIKVNRKKVFATSPRVGILKVGEGLFLDRIQINENTNSEANKIKRLGTLFHEARHSDGHGEHVGFLHHKCPIGHSLSGFYACEPYSNGAYTLEAVATKNLLLNCKSCSIEDKTKLSAAIADSFNRVVVLSHSKSEEQLLKEMETYQNVIDFYVGFIEKAPSNIESSVKELERLRKKYKEAKQQLQELQNAPVAKEMSVRPEGEYKETSVEASSRLMDISIGK